jgi:hypothetical protein
VPPDTRRYAVLNRFGGSDAKHFRGADCAGRVQVLYVIVALGIAFVINYALTAIGVPRVIVAFIALLLNLCTFLYGARVFRGPNELVDPARPWWKMTAGRRLSFLLGFLFSLLGIFWAVVVAVAAALIPAAAKYGPTTAYEQVLTLVVNIPIFLYFAILAFLYGTSSARIPRVVKLGGKSPVLRRSRSTRFT